MGHHNAPLTIEGRRRLVERCKTRPIAHVAAEMGISRPCANTWVNRWRREGELGLSDQSSTPHHSPTATSAEMVPRVLFASPTNISAHAMFGSDTDRAGVVCEPRTQCRWTPARNARLLCRVDGHRVH